MTSATASLRRLPAYARNANSIMRVAAILARHGFGQLLAELGLPVGEGRITLGLSNAVDALPSETTWEVRVRRTLEALGPTFVKLGQVAATRPDIIPMSLIFELRKLQDKVPGFPFEQVCDVVLADFGRPLHQLFQTFDPKPLAAASIAQVHRATLPTGEQVVAKIQRPGLAQTIQNDLEVLRFLAKLVEEKLPEYKQFRPVDAVEQFARGLLREIDFTHEVANLKRFRRNFENEPNLHVPDVHPALCSKRVITMEFIDGCKVTKDRKSTRLNSSHT